MGRRGLSLMTQPQPGDPDPLVQEGREPPRPPPARQRHNRLQASARRAHSDPPTGIGPYPPDSLLRLRLQPTDRHPPRNAIPSTPQPAPQPAAKHTHAPTRRATPRPCPRALPTTPHAPTEQRSPRPPAHRATPPRSSRRLGGRRRAVLSARQEEASRQPRGNGGERAQGDNGHRSPLSRFGFQRWPLLSPPRR